MGGRRSVGECVSSTAIEFAVGYGELCLNYKNAMIKSGILLDWEIWNYEGNETMMMKFGESLEASIH